MKKLFTIHDAAANYYLPPMMFRNQGEAIRNVQHWMKDENSNISKDPESFTLVELGDFDEDTGLIKTHTQPLIVGNASQYVQ